jgi:Cys-tRNA(Pro)/Cys-tRNA(Cys) deacylase
VTPAVRAAEAAGIPHRVIPYETPEEPRALGERAAAALGVPAERVFKTLVARLEPEGLAVAVVPVAARLDPKALATAAGAKGAALAPAPDAERATGYVTGGISPLGLRRPLPVFLDESARRFPTIFVSAGRRGLELELAPADLLDVTRGVHAPLAR